MKKKLLSIALAIAICFTFTPFLPGLDAHADSKVTNATELYNFIIENGGDADLSGNTVILNEYLPLDTYIYFYLQDAGDTITLDLNGYGITSSSSTDVIWKNGAGTLNIVNTSDKKDSRGFPAGNISSVNKTTVYCGQGTVNIVNVTLENLSGKDGTDGSVVNGYGNASLNIYSSYLISYANGMQVQANFNVYAEDTAILLAGEDSFIEPYAVKVTGSNANVVLNDCEVRAAHPGSTAIYLNAPSATVTTYDGIITSSANCVEVMKGRIDINSGYFSSGDVGECLALRTADASAILSYDPYLTGKYIIGVYHSGAQLIVGEVFAAVNKDKYSYGTTLTVPNQTYYNSIFKECYVTDLAVSDFYTDDYGSYTTERNLITYGFHYDISGWRVSIPADNKYPGVEEKVCFTCGERVDERTTPVTLKAPSTMSVNLTTYYSKTGGYNDVKVKWSKVSGASGYYVYYKKATASSYKLLKKTKNTYVYKKDLAAGVKYEFKVVPYVYNDEVNQIFKGGNASKTTITTLKKLPTPTVMKSGSKVRVGWKNIIGESGYQISKSTSKTGTNIVSTYATTVGNYKLLKATKGKKYYYKVRAYKVVDGKKIFGPWSAVKAFTR